MDTPTAQEFFTSARAIWTQVTREGKAVWPAWESKNFEKEMDEALEYDPSGLTAFMLLRGGAESYLKGRTFSAWEVLLNPEAVGDMLGPLKKLRDVLDSPEVVEDIAAFEQEIRRAAADFNLKVPAEKIEELVGPGGRLDLAYLRRAALRSDRRLQTHQFVHGKGSLSVRPRINPHVYEYWNVESLVRHAMGGEDGVTMALVRDPADELFSYFCLLVKSGQSLTVLTDRPAVPHAQHKNMSRSRSRGRQLERRVEQNWFPYEFLDLKRDDRGHVYSPDSRALVPYQVEAIRLAAVADLGAEEFIWFLLTAELVWRRFGAGNERLPELSYVGSAVVNPEVLVGAGSELVLSGTYTPLALAPVTVADLAPEANEDNWKRYGVNDWMEERYGSDIPEEVLNPMGAGGLEKVATALLGAGGTFDRISVQHGTLHRPDHARDRWLGNAPDLTPDTFDPLEFGPARKLDYERRWAARRNQVRVILGRAMKEFDETRAELVEWFRARVESRREWFLNAAVTGTLKLAQRVGDPYESIRVVDEEANSKQDIYTRLWSPAVEGRYLGEGVSASDLAQVVVHGGCDNWRFKCSDNPAVRASARARFRFRDSEGLAAVLGLTRDELPWQLKHWRVEKPYAGNCILDRIDPMDWMLEDPWTSLRCEIHVYLSRRAWAARRKNLGLPPTDWAAIIEASR